MRQTEETVQTQVELRAAKESDCRKFWEWRNESATREASFDTSIILYDIHERWYAKSLFDPSSRLFVALNGSGEEIGYVRFQITGHAAEISVSLDKRFRGQGLGTMVIKAGCERIMREPQVEQIIAHVKCDNQASFAAFQKAGFAVRAEAEIKGVQACEMRYVYDHH